MQKQIDLQGMQFGKKTDFGLLQQYLPEAEVGNLKG
jgi:hypothetical protein